MIPLGTSSSGSSSGPVMIQDQLVLSDTFLGADNSAWPAAWTGPANPTNQKQLNGKGQLIPGNTAYASSGGIVATGMNSVTDLEFVGEAYFDTTATQEQYLWIGWRTDGIESGGQLTNGYKIDWNPAGNSYKITKHVAGVSSDLSAPIAFTYSGGVKFRIRHVQGNLKVRVWSVGSSEPSTWSYEVTEGTPYIAASKVSIKATNGNSTTVRSMSFDNLAVIDLAAPIPSMPASEPSGFTRIFSEDFDTAYPVGAFIAEDDGTGIGRILSSSPAYARYNNKISLYPDNNWDTGHYAKYWPSKTVSTRTDVANANGVLDIYLHTQTIMGEVTPLSAWFRPITVNDVNQRLLYGRYQMRIRADNTAPGYGAVMLLIAPIWPDNGEFDWPEGDVSGPVEGYYHYAAPAGTNPFQMHVTSPHAFWRDWHTYTIEWTSNRLKWFIDSALVLDTTDRVGATRMQFVFQSGGNGSVPAPSSQGHIQVDWVTVASAP